MLISVTDKLWRLGQFLKYYFKAKTLYNVHSPFLYELLKKISDVDKRYYSYDHVERIRTKYLYNDKPLIINDKGAGSSSSNKDRTVASICQLSTSSEKKCRLLYNIADHFKPNITIELGTNLGIASAYLQAAVNNRVIHTIEADSQLNSIAKDTFSVLKLPIVDHLMTFETFFTEYTELMQEADMVYIDGNHTYKGTMDAYHHATQGGHKQKVLIFDDIHWSKDMKRAWDSISLSIKRGYCINLFIIGIVIINPEKDRCENIKFIPWKYKPFSTGLLG